MLCSFPWILLTAVILSGPRSSVLLLVSDSFFSLVRYIPAGLSHADKRSRPRSGRQGALSGSGWCGRINETHCFWKRSMFTFGVFFLLCSVDWLVLVFFSQMNCMLFMPSYKAQQYCNKTAGKWISVRTMLSLILQKQKRNFDTYNGKVFT